MMANEVVCGCLSCCRLILSTQKIHFVVCVIFFLLLSWIQQENSWLADFWMKALKPWLQINTFDEIYVQPNGWQTVGCFGKCGENFSERCKAVPFCQRTYHAHAARTHSIILRFESVQDWCCCCHCQQLSANLISKIPNFIPYFLAWLTSKKRLEIRFIQNTNEDTFKLSKQTDSPKLPFTFMKLKYLQ